MKSHSFWKGEEVWEGPLTSLSLSKGAICKSTVAAFLMETPVKISNKSPTEGPWEAPRDGGSFVGSWGVS